MYDAYAQNDVASKLPLEVSALASSNKKNILYVGSKAGHLLTCFPQTEGKRGFEFQICKSFEKKAITDLQVIESQELILCLTDSQLNVHSIDDQFSLIYSLNKYKPISTFASHVQQENNLLLVTIACKRRLYVFKWLINEFDEVPISFNPSYLLDNPHLITWCGDSSLVFAVKNDYFYVQMFKNENETETDELGKIRCLFNADSRPPDSPLVVDVPDKKVLGLCRDNFIMFINYTGEISREVQSVRFSEPPLVLIYDPPYFVGILQKNIIEIRSLTNSILIQKVQLKSQQKFTHLCQVTRGTVFAASPTNIWELSSRPLLKSNIEFLKKNKNFELAIELAQLCDDLDPNYLVLIKRKAAANFFSQKRFSECFNIHLELKTDVLLVLHFFPQFIPEKYLAKLSQYTNELDSFENSADFAENEKKQAILALTDYLSAMRTEYARIISLHYKDRKENRKENLLQTQELKRLESILELIDTALLKCYLQTKPMLVPSLLRLPDNSCIIGEAEQALRDKKKYAEMFILYERKKMHRKALDLLKTEAKNEDSEHFGHESTVQYLQTLGPDNLPLIFEYSQWVLAENLEMGVQIFATNDAEQVKKWDREKVLSFLAKECVAAIIPYLEHLIYEWHEKRPKFHEALLEQYIAKVTVLMKDYIHALSDNENMIKGGAEEGELGIYRRKLMKFLEFSNEYNPQKILYLLNNNILEERAIVYGRLKMHEEALAIYTSVLLDYKAAERHCNKYYDPKDPINSQVFLTLFKAYTNPIDPSKAEIQTHLAKTPKPNVNEALRILRCHAARINTIEAIPLIPVDTPLNMVWNALEAVLEATKNKASSLTMHLALSKLALEKCQTHLKKLQSAKIVIDYTVECSMCKKKIANRILNQMFKRQEGTMPKPVKNLLVDLSKISKEEDPPIQKVIDWNYPHALLTDPWFCLNPDTYEADLLKDGVQLPLPIYEANPRSSQGSHPSQPSMDYDDFYDYDFHDTGYISDSQDCKFEPTSEFTVYLAEPIPDKKRRRKSSGLGSSSNSGTTTPRYSPRRMISNVSKSRVVTPSKAMVRTQISTNMLEPSSSVTYDNSVGNNDYVVTIGDDSDIEILEETGPSLHNKPSKKPTQKRAMPFQNGWISSDDEKEQPVKILKSCRNRPPTPIRTPPRPKNSLKPMISEQDPWNSEPIYNSTVTENELRIVKPDANPFYLKNTSPVRASVIYAGEDRNCQNFDGRSYYKARVTKEKIEYPTSRKTKTFWSGATSTDDRLVTTSSTSLANLASSSQMVTPTKLTTEFIGISREKSRPTDSALRNAMAAASKILNPTQEPPRGLNSLLHEQQLKNSMESNLSPPDIPNISAQNNPFNHWARRYSNEPLFPKEPQNNISSSSCSTFGVVKFPSQNFQFPKPPERIVSHTAQMGVGGFLKALREQSAVAPTKPIEEMESYAPMGVGGFLKILRSQNMPSTSNQLIRTDHSTPRRRNEQEFVAMEKRLDSDGHHSDPFMEIRDFRKEQDDGTKSNSREIEPVLEIRNPFHRSPEYNNASNSPPNVRTPFRSSTDRHSNITRINYNTAYSPSGSYNPRDKNSGDCNDHHPPHSAFFPSTNAHSSTHFYPRNRYNQGITSAEQATSVNDDVDMYKKKFLTEFEDFNKDIQQLIGNIQQDNNLLDEKLEVLAHVKELVKKEYADAKVYMVGSSHNGSGLKTSDLDITVIRKEKDVPWESHGSNAERILQKMHQIFEESSVRRSSIVEHSQLILHARHPILKLSLKKPFYHIKVDLQINNENSIRGTFLISHYLRIDPRARILSLLVKEWTKIVGIRGVRNGYPGSFAYLIMVVHYLQCVASPPILPNLQYLYPEFFHRDRPVHEIRFSDNLPHPLPEKPSNSQTIGELLLGFVTYYSMFDYANKGICIWKGSAVSREKFTKTRHQKILVLDPFGGYNAASGMRQDNFENFLDKFAHIQDYFLTQENPPVLFPRK